MQQQSRLRSGQSHQNALAYQRFQVPVHRCLAEKPAGYQYLHRVYGHIEDQARARHR